MAIPVSLSFNRFQTFMISATHVVSLSFGYFYLLYLYITRLNIRYAPANSSEESWFSGVNVSFSKNSGLGPSWLSISIIKYVLFRHRNALFRWVHQTNCRLFLLNRTLEAGASPIRICCCSRSHKAFIYPYMMQLLLQLEAKNPPFSINYQWRWI